MDLASSGAHTPGIDGIDKQRMQAGLAEHLSSLHTDLLSGNYTPQQVRRIYIPKANGKKRPLGIPTLKDRIVQRAMLMAMEPIWESDFHRLSYGVPARTQCAPRCPDCEVTVAGWKCRYAGPLDHRR